MKALIFALGLWAAVAWTQDYNTEPDTRPHPTMPDGSAPTTWAEAFECCVVEEPEHPAHGFGGYAFDSSRAFVHQERAFDGYMIWRVDGQWTWYHGSIDGCKVEVGYQFDHRERLAGGIWKLPNTNDCFNDIQDVIIETYGDNLLYESGDQFRITTLRIHWTKIVQRKDTESHTVTFIDIRS